MTNKINSEHCLLCDEGRMVIFNNLQHKFRYGPHEHRVNGLSHAICDRCGTSAYLPGQLAENNRRIKEFQKNLVKIIGPSEILALRVKYSLSQVQAAKIFGGGTNAFSKWERGEVIPTESTANLLRLAFESEDAMERLAKRSGVQLEQGLKSEPLIGDKSLMGWLWNSCSRATEPRNAPRFVYVEDIAGICTINDEWYSDESQSATA